MSIRPLTTLLLLALLVVQVCAGAQVLIKPKGQNAASLSLKTMAADAVIDRQVATTTLNLIFHNDIAARIEAEFLYTVTPGTIVSHFAYWYGDEKVVARIVEKERAAAIYEHITT